MNRIATRFTTAALLAAAFAIPAVQAQDAPSTPESRATEAAKKGPDSLRRFINRTRMIYALHFNDFYAPKE